MSLQSWLRNLFFFWLVFQAEITICATSQEDRGATYSLALRGLRVVVSARSVQAVGRSYWHLYLYNGEGKLLRRLTSGTGWDYVNPVFSPDGREIVFARMPAKYKHEIASSLTNYYQISANGSNLRLCDDGSTAPAWYRKTKHLEEPREHNYHFPYDPYNEQSPGGTTDSLNEHAWKYDSPDRRFTLLVHDVDEFKDQLGLRLFGSNVEVPAWNMTPYEQKVSVFQDVSHCSALGWGETPWLSRPPLSTVILWNHLNSTVGTAYFALDPKHGFVHELSSNRAEVLLLPGLPIIVVLNQERYTEIPGSPKTTNCLALDLWTPEFARHRLSPKLPIFGGASFYQPERAKNGDTVHSLHAEL